jgi:hypothetical protein
MEGNWKNTHSRQRCLSGWPVNSTPFSPTAQLDPMEKYIQSKPKVHKLSQLRVSPRARDKGQGQLFLRRKSHRDLKI